MSRIVKCLLCSQEISVAAQSDEVIRLSSGRRLHRPCLRRIEGRVREAEGRIGQLEVSIREIQSDLIALQVRQRELVRIAQPGLFRRFASWLSGEEHAARMRRESAELELLSLKAVEATRSTELERSERLMRSEKQNVEIERRTLKRIYTFWPGDPPDWETRKKEALRHGRSCQWKLLRHAHKFRELRCLGPLHVHHKRLVIEGGSHAPENLMLLCQRHHEIHHGYRIGPSDDRGTRFYSEDKLRKPVASDRERVLENAVQHDSTIRIEYTNRLGIQTIRDITPKEVFRGRFGRRYLRAYCHLRNEDRTFRIARIRSIG